MPQTIKLESPVIHGFGRGSKLLGIPTANLNMDIVGETVEKLATGIYFGYSRIRGSTYESVISIGWNPFFQNAKKAIVSYLLQNTYVDHEIRKRTFCIVLSLIFTMRTCNSSSVDICVEKKTLAELVDVVYHV